MNARRFLFTFDLALSPPKNDGAKRRRGGGAEKKGRMVGGGGGGGGRKSRQREGGKKGRGEEERKRGEAGQLLLLLPPYLLSPSLYFFSFCLSEGKLGGQLLLPRLQPPAALLTNPAAVFFTGSERGRRLPNGARAEKGADPFFFCCCFFSFQKKKKKELARELRLNQPDKKNANVSRWRTGDAVVAEEGEAGGEGAGGRLAGTVGFPLRGKSSVFPFAACRRGERLRLGSSR